RDIHRQKKIEHELVRKSENLKELNATKDKFFKILAHDLRNPFFGISGVTEILKERLSNIPNYDTAELQKMVNLIQASTGSASALLENLMEWAKAQTGSLQIDLVEFNINKEIEKVIDLIKGSAFHKNITIEFKLENVNSVLADSYLTNTILRNLLSNSIKFTPIGGNIKIVVKQTGKNVEIAITDTGIGIPEESIKKLFRIDSKFTMLGTEKEKGTGLGLIICKEFAERQNGFIRVQSAVGEGSTFTLCLPHI
ncbi:MAG TPA: HAMP domain-containing sensor histidine kinase, partial [Leptospiraceae bacterium]|nr:HAMP domain-containing sensor histidine kinase [Leptospiraceae bacterium]